MSASTAAAGVIAFDPELLRETTFADRLWNWAMGPPSFLIFAFMRRFVPNKRVGTYVLATRREDVEWVLAQTDSFEVRLGTRMASLISPRPFPDFGLGTDGNDYAPSLKLSSKGVHLGDDRQVAKILSDCVTPYVAGPAVDVANLARNAQANVARTYLGLDVGDEKLPELALRILAVANYALGAQDIKTKAGQAAHGAAPCLYQILRDSIASRRKTTGGDTVTDRLIASGANDGTIEATLAGLAVALLAAPTLAITNITEVLLKRPTALDAAKSAMRAGDELLLHRVLLEALRFQPISPGPVRFCTTATTIAAGTGRQCSVRVGDTVIAATQSAMFDPRAVQRPGRFDPDRAPEESLVFGFGRHTCLGFMLGRAQITETLRPLLTRGFSQTAEQRRAITRFGLFRENFFVQLG